jgi:hypothetical protein
METQGVVVWPCRFIDAGDDLPASGSMVRLTRIAVVVVEMEGEEISRSVIPYF